MDEIGDSPIRIVAFWPRRIKSKVDQEVVIIREAVINANLTIR